MFGLRQSDSANPAISLLVVEFLDSTSACLFVFNVSVKCVHFYQLSLLWCTWSNSTDPAVWSNRWSGGRLLTADMCHVAVTRPTAGRDRSITNEINSPTSQKCQNNCDTFKSIVCKAQTVHMLLHKRFSEVSQSKLIPHYLTTSVSSIRLQYIRTWTLQFSCADVCVCGLSSSTASYG